jgi:hypothetical protein
MNTASIIIDSSLRVTVMGDAWLRQDFGASIALPPGVPLLDGCREQSRVRLFARPAAGKQCSTEPALHTWGTAYRTPRASFRQAVVFLAFVKQEHAIRYAAAFFFFFALGLATLSK